MFVYLFVMHDALSDSVYLFVMHDALSDSVSLISCNAWRPQWLSLCSVEWMDFMNKELEGCGTQQLYHNVSYYPEIPCRQCSRLPKYVYLCKFSPPYRAFVIFLVWILLCTRYHANWAVNATQKYLHIGPSFANNHDLNDNIKLFLVLA
jgi:hypothetical protein